MIVTVTKSQPFPSHQSCVPYFMVTVTTIITCIQNTECPIRLGRVLVL